MKSKLKSVFISLGVASFSALLLTGCSENGPSTLPHVISGVEVPQEVIDQPRVVQTPKTTDMSQQPYPRLGDVPSKPKDFSPQPVLDQARDELEHNRAQGQKAVRDYEYEYQMPATHSNANFQ